MKIQKGSTMNKNVRVIEPYLIDLDGLHIIWTCALNSKQGYQVFIGSFIHYTFFFYKFLISGTVTPLNTKKKNLRIGASFCFCNIITYKPYYEIIVTTYLEYD